MCWRRARTESAPRRFGPTRWLPVRRLRRAGEGVVPGVLQRPGHRVAGGLARAHATGPGPAGGGRNLRGWCPRVDRGPQGAGTASGADSVGRTARDQPDLLRRRRPGVGADPVAAERRAQTGIPPDSCAGALGRHDPGRSLGSPSVGRRRLVRARPGRGSSRAGCRGTPPKPDRVDVVAGREAAGLGEGLVARFAGARRGL